MARLSARVCARGLLVVFAVIGFSSAARAALQFSAFMHSEGKPRFQITDDELGTKSAWLTIGDAFQGHRITAFDSEAAVLVIEREGKSARLPLIDSRVQEGASEAATQATPPREHVVARGETLWAISKKYGLSMSRLVELNPHLKGAKTIKIGDKVRIRQ